MFGVHFVFADVGYADGFERSKSDVEREEPYGRTAFADFGNEGLGKMQRRGGRGQRTFLLAEFGLVVESLFVGIFDVRRKRKLAVRMEEIVNRTSGQNFQNPSVRNFGFDFEHETAEFDLGSHRKSRAGEDEGFEKGFGPQFPEKEYLAFLFAAESVLVGEGRGFEGYARRNDPGIVEEEQASVAHQIRHVGKTEVFKVAAVGNVVVFARKSEHLGTFRRVRRRLGDTVVGQMEGIGGKREFCVHWKRYVRTESDN